jgi:hypothetical protein
MHTYLFYPRIFISYKTRNEKAASPTSTHLLVQVEYVPTYVDKKVTMSVPKDSGTLSKGIEKGSKGILIHCQRVLGH